MKNETTTEKTERHTIMTHGNVTVGYHWEVSRQGGVLHVATSQTRFATNTGARLDAERFCLFNGISY